VRGANESGPGTAIVPSVVGRASLRIVAGFWLLAGAITAFGAFSIHQWGVVRPIYSGEFRARPAVLEMWSRFDGSWYQQIATDGYFYDRSRQSSIVFFPTYPLALKPWVELGLNPYLAGFFLTLLATSVAVIVFMAWQRDFQFSGSVSGDAAFGTHDATQPSQLAINYSTLAWLAYPYAFFLYGSLYSDALFAAVTITAFWLIERDRPIQAGIVGIAATAARPFGWAVTVGMAIRILERRWRQRHNQDLTITTLIRHPFQALSYVTARDLAVGLSGIGVVSWLSYLWIRFGSPKVFIWNEAFWGQGSDSSILVKVVFWRSVSEWRTSPVTAATLLAQAIIGLGLTTIGAWAVYRRFGLGLATYVFLTIAPPLLFTKDFQGIGRYALSAFPCFAIIGLRLSPYKRFAPVVLASSAFSMVILGSLFARGYYLS
jgi:hypothetical protein